MATVELRGVSKSFGQGLAVDRVSFAAQSGSLVALLGPSGCGKSTTLRLIAGLEEVSEGTILIDGRDMTSKAPAERGLSMVFQSYALFPHLSVAENILFGLRVRKVSAHDRKRRLDRASEILGLGALLERKPAQLSGGQQQRVALGRAIVAETSVCLMDEPLSNLDAQLRAEMRREIRELQQRLQMTLLYVTHDQVEAMTMADQIILMNAGRIEQNGSPAELYENPASTFAARFVGTPPMNVVPYAAARGTANWLDRAAPQNRGADDLAFGVRPESVRLDDAGLAATVTACEYLGADSLVDVRIGSHALTMRMPGRNDTSIGDTLKIAWPAAATCWFSMSSGSRVV